MMMKTCFLALCAATASYALTAQSFETSPEELQMQQAFTEFIKEHNKEYPLEEVFQRFNIFKKHHKHIEEQNSRPGKDFELKMNRFGDLTEDEFASRAGYNHEEKGFIFSQNEWSAAEHADGMFTASVAGDIDWVAKGAVTAVKNQGHCGSCWTFSSTGAIEGAVAVHTGNLISLSEQQLADCADAQYGNKGCHGGAQHNAFEYVIRQGGLTSEQNYPYVADSMEFSEPCRDAQYAPTSSISAYKMVRPGDENILLQVLQMQPVAVSIAANSPNFMFYHSGVMTGECDNQLDHAVLLVGAGHDEAGIPYWTIKNSWGTVWGDQGYIKIQRGVGKCGIGQYATIPVV